MAIFFVITILEILHYMNIPITNSCHPIQRLMSVVFYFKGSLTFNYLIPQLNLYSNIFISFTNMLYRRLYITYNIILHWVRRLEIFSFYLNNLSTNIQKLEGMGGYGPLLLAPAEGLGALRAPYQVGVIYCSN